MSANITLKTMPRFNKIKKNWFTKLNAILNAFMMIAEHIKLLGSLAG